jgi:iron complex outermembrane receptor protein
MRQFRAPDVFPFENIFETGVNTPLPASFDFAPAPDGYFLLGAEAGVRIGNGTLSVQLENALNKNYRDYMNRFRFFADAMGTNLTLRYKQSF